MESLRLSDLRTGAATFSLWGGPPFSDVRPPSQGASFDCSDCGERSSIGDSWVTITSSRSPRRRTFGADSCRGEWVMVGAFFSLAFAASWARSSQPLNRPFSLRFICFSETSSDFDDKRFTRFQCAYVDRRSLL